MPVRNVVVSEKNEQVLLTSVRHHRSAGIVRFGCVGCAELSHTMIFARLLQRCIDLIYYPLQAIPTQYAFHARYGLNFQVRVIQPATTIFTGNVHPPGRDVQIVLPVHHGVTPFFCFGW